MRKKLIAGNWKMFTNLQGATELAQGIVDGLGSEQRVQVAVFPPFPYLLPVAEVVKGSPVLLGAQNLYPEKEGAFTGEVSPTMLRDVGCRHVILGHSERRHKLGESDAFINRKVKVALEAGLDVILCVGETIEERQGNRIEQTLDRQITSGLAGVSPQDMARVVVAYEPVWAIGTGQIATPEQAQQAHAFLRRRAGEMFGSGVAQNLTILYGGSAKPENIITLVQQPDVDGGLVGAASLKVDLFLSIVRIALSQVSQ